MKTHSVIPSAASALLAGKRTRDEPEDAPRDESEDEVLNGEVFDQYVILQLSGLLVFAFLHVSLASSGSSFSPIFRSINDNDVDEDAAGDANIDDVPSASSTVGRTVGQ